MLRLSTRYISISHNLYIYIPTLREIDNCIEELGIDYYSLVAMICANPKDYAVQLDDMGLKYTQISSYELFNILFSIYINNEKEKSKLKIIFGDKSDLNLHIQESEINNSYIWCNEQGETIIDEFTHLKIEETLRSITGLQKDLGKAGNSLQYEREIKKKRKLLDRPKNNQGLSFLDRQIVMVVNSGLTVYDYNTILDMTLYQLNQSVKQIPRTKELDYMKQSAYVGMFDISKIKNEDLSLIPMD
jgi:signal recognition particle subunit SEC65